MYVIKGKNIIIALVCCLCVFTLFLCSYELSVKKNNIVVAHRMTVVIDAGHGGVDGGVVGVKSGVKESVINLAVSKKLERLFDSAGMKVVLTRNSEAGLYGAATTGFKKRDMLKRKEIIDKSNADVVISIHQNKCPISTRRGAQVFFQLNNNDSQLLANSVQQSLNEMKEASRTCITLKGDYYILNCSKPTAILVECGFLSNVQDEELLLDSAYQENISYAIFKGVINYFASK